MRGIVDAVPCATGTGLRYRGVSRRVASALLAAAAATLAAAAPALAAKPAVSGFEASPVPVEGGQPATITASVTGGSSCTLSSNKPVAGLPATFPCEGEPARVEQSVTFPNSTKGKDAPYKLELAVSGPEGDTKAKLAVTVAPMLLRATQVSAGAEHTCALLADGHPVCWGTSTSYQLGFPGGKVHLPVEVPGVSDATRISAGSFDACATISGGTAECWGYGANGAIGSGSHERYDRPSSVSGMTEAVEVSAGLEHTCATLYDGHVDCWGLDFRGQPVEDDELFQWTPVEVPGPSDAVQVALGQFHACALLATGHVDCWGSDSRGQIGNGEEGEEVGVYPPVEVVGLGDATAVAAGGELSCALLTTGHVDCWGWGLDGELGDGGTADSDVPVEVAGIEDATAISAGSAAHACAVLAGGHVDCWGSGEDGQLGDGSTENSDTPVQVTGIDSATAVTNGGDESTCALLAGGEVDCWGNNAYAQLGVAGKVKTSSVPLPVLAP